MYLNRCMGSNDTHMIPGFRKTVIATQQFFQVTRAYPVQLCFTGVILDFLFVKCKKLGLLFPQLTVVFTRISRHIKDTNIVSQNCSLCNHWFSLKLFLKCEKDSSCSFCPCLSDSVINTEYMITTDVVNMLV